MNKKNIRNMFLMMLLGAVIGASASVTLVFLSKGNALDDIIKTSQLFIKVNSIQLYIGLFIVMFLPAVYFLRKGMKSRLELMSLMEEETEDNEDECDAKENLVDLYFAYAVTINSVYMFTLIMFYGLSFTVEKWLFVYQIVAFMILLIASSSFEVIMINFIKKTDPRIKGDPTTTSFHKDFVESLDEAEQLKTYKVGYKAFLSSRNIGIVFLVISILLKLVFEAGDLAIITSGLLIIFMQLSYTYHEVKE